MSSNFLRCPLLVKFLALYLARNDGGYSQAEVSAMGWRKPDFGRLKLHSDGAWRKETRVGGVGWVLHDFAGIPKLVGGKGGDYFLSSIMVENSAYVLHGRSQARIKEEGEGVR
ncbi:hypothetical protein TB1_021829 [Malus domestica]